MSSLEYLFEHGYISITDIQLCESSDTEGQSIAKKLGVRFLGFWAELNKFVFNDDDVTESSFTAKDMEEAKEKLKKLRISFAKV